MPVGKVVADLGALTLLAAFGRDQHNARSTARTVDCSRGSIFQNINTFNVARIDVNILRSGITVDDIQRIAAGRERVDAPHTDLHALTRSTACLTDFDTGNLARKCLRHGGGRSREFAGLDAGYRACEVALAHRRIAYDEHVRDLLAVLLERDVEVRGAAHPDVVWFIPQVVDFQNSLRNGGGT